VTSGHHMGKQDQPRPPRDNGPDTDMCADGLWLACPGSARHRRLTQSVADPVPVANLTTGLMRALVWSVVVCGCGGWTLGRSGETRLGAFEMEGLRRILRVSWAAKKTNEWVLGKAGVKRELLDTVKARRLAYYGYTMRKQGNCLERGVVRGAVPGARGRWGTMRAAWMDGVGSWTGLSVEESIRVTEGGGRWREWRCVHGVANPRIEEG